MYLHKYYIKECFCSSLKVWWPYFTWLESVHLDGAVLYFNYFSQCCNGVTLCKLYRHGLYVCNILETVHHRTTFRIFCNFTQKTIPEENSCKMFHTSSLIVIFLMERSRTFFWDKDQIHLGRANRRGNRGNGGEAQMRCFFFFAKFPSLSKIQTLSHKLFIWQTSNHHCFNQHAQNPICRDFQVISSSSSWSKTSNHHHFKQFFLVKNNFVYF